MAQTNKINLESRATAEQVENGSETVCACSSQESLICAESVFQLII